MTAVANEVHGRLLNLHTKRAQPTFRPSTSEQSIGRPDSILDDKPSKELTLGGSPDPPSCGDHGRGGQAGKLCLVRRGHGVLPIGSEFRRDGVQISLREVSMSKLFLEVGELLNVLQGNVKAGVNLTDPRVILHSHANRATLFAREVEDFEGDVYWSNALKPRRIPKISFISVSHNNLGGRRTNFALFPSP